MVSPSLDIIALVHKLSQIVLFRRKRVDEPENVLRSARHLPNPYPTILVRGEHPAPNRHKRFNRSFAVSKLGKEPQIGLLPHDDVVALRRAEEELAAQGQARDGADMAGEDGEGLVGEGLGKWY